MLCRVGERHHAPMLGHRPSKQPARRPSRPPALNTHNWLLWRCVPLAIGPPVTIGVRGHGGTTVGPADVLFEEVFLDGVRGGVRAAGRGECSGEEFGAVTTFEGLVDPGS